MPAGRHSARRLRWREAFAALAVASGPVLVPACMIAGSEADAPASPRRAAYRPGQSLESRRCECTECHDRACCDGDSEQSESSASDGELGMTLSSCGRCVRRVWSVPVGEPCERRAAPCCPGSLQE